MVNGTIVNAVIPLIMSIRAECTFVPVLVHIIKISDVYGRI